MEDTETVEFDIDSVTVEEAIDLEDAVGVPWLECISTKSGSAKVMRGFVWLAKRRAEPDLKLEDVHFNIQSFGEQLGQRPVEESPDPLGVSEPSATSSKSSSTRSTESAPGSSNGSPSSSSSDAAPVSPR